MSYWSIRSSHRKAPAELVLDFDATDDAVHGRQEGCFFHGYYDHYCFLPLYVFCGDQLLVAYLRPSNIDASKQAAAILKLLVQRIRESWPQTRLIFRGDSGFCRPRNLRWCEAHEVDYMVGIARNGRLLAQAKGRAEYLEGFICKLLICRCELKAREGYEQSECLPARCAQAGKQRLFESFGAKPRKDRRTFARASRGAVQFGSHGAYTEGFEMGHRIFAGNRSDGAYWREELDKAVGSEGQRLKTSSIKPNTTGVGPMIVSWSPPWRGQGSRFMTGAIVRGQRWRTGSKNR